MNRQQRRAKYHQDDTLSRLRAAIAGAPRDARARNELGSALLSQGKLAEASEQFAQALLFMPELLEQHAQIVATLLQVNPALRACIARLSSGLRPAADLDDWIAPGDFLAIARDPLFRTLLELSPVRDPLLERFLTLMRRSLLGAASGSLTPDRAEKTRLEFSCVLARQCFLNEYVFAIAPEEREEVERLQKRLTGDLAGGRPVAAIWPVLLASYVPLTSVPAARFLLEQTWPSAVRAVLRQQLTEPEEQQRSRNNIPRLTPVEDRVSRQVQDQYEENPYPRWVAPVSTVKSTKVEVYLRQLLPASNFPQLSPNDPVEILVAGCGTGQQSIASACRFAGAKVLAIDLSLSSLAYAKWMSEAMHLRNIEYAQADILELTKLGRKFDVIEASGVLHHMAQPVEGWRILLSLLRQGGLMNIGLYSRTGRRVVQRAREFVVEKGYQPTPEGIRRLRQDILLTPLRDVSKWGDFYTTSECRDLLFHVQEHQTTIPEIARFIDEHRLRFIGFHLMPQIADAYRRRFPKDVSLTDLSCWNAFENENPYTFSSMYQFWVHKD